MLLEIPRQNWYPNFLFTNLKGLDTTICVSYFISVNISSLSIWREKLHTNKVPIPIFFQKHFHHVWFKVLLLAVFSPPTKQVFCLTVSSFSYTVHCCMKCPQIPREKTLSQKFTVIALRIQWKLFTEGNAFKKCQQIILPLIIINAIIFRGQN